MKVYCIFSLLVLASCASISQKERFLSLSLANVSQVRIGKATASDLHRQFGEPSAVVPVGQYHSWVYRFNGEQRAAFTLDSRQVVLSALWMPLSEQHDCASKECLLAYFKDSHFIEELKYEKVGKMEKVPYFNFADPNSGISFQLPKSSKRISSVVFNAPDQE